MDKNIGIFDKDEASSFNVDDLGTTKESNTQIERNYGNMEIEVNKKDENLYKREPLSDSDIDDLGVTEDSGTPVSTEQYSDSSAKKKDCEKKELGEDKNNEISVKEEAPFISNADDVGTAVDSSTPVSTGNTADSDATGNNSKNDLNKDAELSIKEEELSISDLDDSWAAEHCGTPSSAKNTLESEETENARKSVKPELDETEHTEISVEKEQVSSSDVNNVVTSTDGDAAGNNDENEGIEEEEEPLLVATGDDLNITISTENSADSDVTESNSEIAGISFNKCKRYRDGSPKLLNTFTARNTPRKRSKYFSEKIRYVNPNSPIYISSDSESEDQNEYNTKIMAADQGDNNSPISCDSSSAEELEPLRL